MTPCPFVPTDARRRAVSASARDAFVAGHASRRRRRERLSGLPTLALTGGALVYLAWVLAAARGLLSG